MQAIKAWLAAIALFFSTLSFQTHAPFIGFTSPTPTMIPASPTPTTTPTYTPSPTYVPTKKPTPIPSPIVNTEVKGAVSINVSDVGGMATPDQLFNEMNNYRKANGLGTLSKDGDLCRIAQTRANQQQQAGSLDNHAGFQGQAATQKTFHHVGEILQHWTIPRSASYLVETGWAGSGEHAAVMRDGKWTHGCGGVAGFFAVFIFGG